MVIATRDHARDEQALAHALRRPHRYLGMIGSRRKVHAILARILRREQQLGRPAPDLPACAPPSASPSAAAPPRRSPSRSSRSSSPTATGAPEPPMNIVPQAIARTGRT
jgi:xanthine dehydrogenase accessory factor